MNDQNKSIAALEKEAADIAAEISAAESRKQLAERAYQLRGRLSGLQDQAQRHFIEHERSKLQAVAFGEAASRIKVRAAEIRFGLERLKAGAADDLARLASMHNSLAAIEFFEAHHGKRVKTHETFVKRRAKLHADVSAEMKLVEGELGQTESELNKARDAEAQHAEANFN